MADPGIPQITDKRPKIARLLPKNAQERVLAGIALVMVLVMVFPSHQKPKERPAQAAPAPSQEPISEASIQEYRSRIEEQARELAAEEAQLAQTKQALGVRPVASAPVPGGSPGTLPQAPVEKSWIAVDKEKREYQGLYASNVALTYRQGPAAGAPKVEPTVVPNSLAPNPPAGPGPSKDRESTSANDAPKPREYRLSEGTILETVLTNRLDSSFSGPVNCMVTTNVYAEDHQTLLIPQGTRVLGEVRRLESMGEQRLAVSFHRMILSDGSSVSLDQFKGLSQVGETGLRDQVNHHYGQIFGVSLALGAIAGLAQANTQYGLNESAADVYRQGVTASLSQSSMRILDRYLNVLPTFTIREGHRIKVYLSQDLMLPAYGQHPVPSE